MNGLFWIPAVLVRQMNGSSGGGMGFFVVLLIIGIIAFLVLRGRQDRAEQVGAPIRAMGSGPVQGQGFACPYPKCPTCGAAGEKMKQAWDGLRKVTWTCGYCGGVAGIQELTDEELPPGARARLGLDLPQGMAGQPGGYGPQGPQGGGMDGLLTGMVLGEMLGGERRYPRDQGGWSGGGDPGAGDWSGGNDPAAGGGGDWNDAGSGDSGGGDTGGEF
jgi:hypothetical protein